MGETRLKKGAQDAIVAMQHRNLETISTDELHKLIDKFETLKAEEKAAAKLIIEQNKEYNTIIKEIENILAELGQVPAIDLTFEEIKTIIEKIEKKRAQKAKELAAQKQLEAPILD